MANLSAEIQQILESSKKEIKHRYELYIFILNYDKNDKLTNNPIEISKTIIETHEQDISILKDSKEMPSFNIKDSMKDDFLKIKPIIIQYETRFDDTIITYLKRLYKNINTNDFPKSFKLNIIDPSNYKKYKMRDIFLKVLLSLNYIDLDLDLYDREIEINGNFNADISSFSLQNARLIVTDNPIFNCNTFLLNKINFLGIKSNEESNIYPTISIEAKNSVSLTDLVITETVVCFNISTQVSDTIKWTNTSVSMNNVFFTYKNKELTNKLFPLFSIYGCKKVQISGYNYTTNISNINLFKFENCSEIELLMLNILVLDKISKHLLILDKCDNVKVVNCTVSQKSDENKTKINSIPYFLNLINNGVLAEYQILNLNLTNIGLILFVNDSSKKITIMNSTLSNVYELIKFKSSIINTFQILESVLKNISKIHIFANKINFTNTELPLQELNIQCYESLILTDPSIICTEDLTIWLNGVDNKITFNNGLVKAKNIYIYNDSGNGVFQTNETRLEAFNDIKIEGLNKISLPKGIIESNNISLKAKSLSNLTSLIKTDILDEIKIIGKIATSDFNFQQKNDKTNTYSFENVVGNFKLQFNKGHEISLKLKDCFANLDILNADSEKELKIDVYNLEGNIGSSITNKDYTKVKYVLSPDGKNINDFYNIKDNEEFKKIKYIKETIRYGILKD
jgi:hypothetical protein